MRDARYLCCDFHCQSRSSLSLRSRISRLVPTGFNEFEILADSSLCIYRWQKPGTFDAMRFKFVVPTENTAGARKSQRDRCPQEFRCIRWAMGEAARLQRLALRNLSIKRQLVQHVRQSFGVHQPMLDGNVEQRAEREAIEGRSGESLEIGQRIGEFRHPEVFRTRATYSRTAEQSRASPKADRSARPPPTGSIPKAKRRSNFG